MEYPTESNAVYRTQMNLVEFLNSEERQDAIDFADELRGYNFKGIVTDRDGVRSVHYESKPDNWDLIL